MAEAIPFSIVENILMKLGSSAGQAIGLAFGVRKELAKLQETLSTIRDVLLDAEQRQAESHAVQNWVRKLKEVIYDADDLLDDFACHYLRPRGIARQVGDFFSSSNQVVFRFKMGLSIADIKGKLDDITNEISRFNFIQTVTTNMRVNRETFSFVVMSDIIGRDDDKEKIIEILLQSNNEKNLSVVAIVGIGGLGKTTLAQLVYNDENVVNHFDLRLWVCVSNDFDVKILVKNIIKSNEDVENLSLELLTDKLREELAQKKYLLVLDDVWNEDFQKWNQLRNLLNLGARGSKVLVTTRKPNVASTMGINSPYVLEGLNKGQSWALFKSLAFGSDQQNAHPKLLEIGEEITKMCSGVPLAITILGGILHSKTEESEWSSIKDNKNLMLLRDENNLSSILKLSYDNLPRHLKQCFTYCALFPKDYEINKKMLIQLWMAQGYIQPLDENEVLKLEDIGDQYFKELLSRSMFQEVEKDDRNNIISCKMHDLIHDLARSIVKSEIFILTDDVKNMSERVHHLSILGWSQGMKVLKGNSIRTLFIPSNSEYDATCANSMVNTLVLNCKYLRALSLGFKLTKLPKSLIKLRHLRYLDLSFGRFEVLPSGITSLKNLQTLRLLFCQSLKELSIREMISLRHLEIVECRRLNCRLGELTMLQTLHLVRLHALEYMFKNSSSAEPFPSLKTLELVGLRFKGWWREIAREQSPSFPSLSQLMIRYCEQLTTVQLSSCPSLSTFEIRRCPQLTTVQLPSCPSLSTFEIRWCDQLTTVQLSSCPSLSKLVINCCKSFESLHLPSCSSPSELEISYCDRLTTVQLPSCPSLSTFEISRCDQLTTVQLSSCPSLSKLVISWCKSFESLQLPSCPSLFELEIYGCDQLTTVPTALISPSF